MTSQAEIEWECQNASSFHAQVFHKNAPRGATGIERSRMDLGVKKATVFAASLCEGWMPINKGASACDYFRKCAWSVADFGSWW
jgi:hypothetical protein